MPRASELNPSDPVYRKARALTDQMARAEQNLKDVAQAVREFLVNPGPQSAADAFGVYGADAVKYLEAFALFYQHYEGQSAPPPTPDGVTIAAGDHGVMTVTISTPAPATSAGPVAPANPEKKS